MSACVSQEPASQDAKPPDYVQACAIAANVIRDMALQKVLGKMKSSFVVSGSLATVAGVSMLFLELYEAYALGSQSCLCTGLPTAGMTMLIGLLSLAGAKSAGRVFCLLNAVILLGVLELVLVFVHTINSIRDWFVSDSGGQLTSWQAVHGGKFVLVAGALAVVFYQVCAYVKHCFNYGEVRANQCNTTVARRVLFHSASFAGDAEDDCDCDRPRFSDPPPDYATVTNTSTGNQTDGGDHVGNNGCGNQTDRGNHGGGRGNHGDQGDHLVAECPGNGNAQLCSITIVISSEDD